MTANSRNNLVFQLFSCVVIVLGSIYLIVISKEYPLEAKIFPMSVLSVAVLSSIVQIIKLLVLNKKFELCKLIEVPKNICLNDSSIYKMLSSCLVFGLYVWSIPLLGFYTATLIMLLIFLSWFQKMSKLKNFILSSVIVVVLYTLFTMLLKVPLPLGFLL